MLRIFSFLCILFFSLPCYSSEKVVVVPLNVQNVLSPDIYTISNSTSFTSSQTNGGVTLACNTGDVVLNSGYYFDGDIAEYSKVTVVADTPASTSAGKSNRIWFFGLYNNGGDNIIFHGLIRCLKIK